MSQEMSPEEIAKARLWREKIEQRLAEFMTDDPVINEVLNEAKDAGRTIRYDFVQAPVYIDAIKPKPETALVAVPSFEPLGTLRDLLFLQELKIRLD